MPRYCSATSSATVKRLVGRVAPELGAHALVQALGEGLGETIGQRLQHDRAVVVEVGGELALLLLDAEPGGHREQADVVVRCPSPWAR